MKRRKLPAVKWADVQAVREGDAAPAYPGGHADHVRGVQDEQLSEDQVHARRRYR
jgi:hypothetical protein